MPGEREAIAPRLPPGHEVLFLDEKLSLENAGRAANAEVISVFVKSDASAAVLDRLGELKLIATRSMGYDHIDVEHARGRGVKVSNVTTYASHPVAEFTFALLLCVMRRIYHAYNQLREGTSFDQRGLSGFNLFGKTIGVVGTGRIGRNVASIARGFGMRVLCFDAKPDDAMAAKEGFSYVAFDELLAQSDVVSLHVPYLKETHHLMNAEKFAKMKKGSVLINTARGEVVDTHALVAALRDGTLWGAGLDVLEEERALTEEAETIARGKAGVDYELLTANHVLIDLPNVIVTPHIAYETAEAMAEISRVTLETITNFLTGKEQKYL
jgi:D-lactate dehydrogenase